MVGAGPAGAAAAVALARAGRSVHLLDKAAFPRDKCCGDGLTATALRELEALGLDPGTLPAWEVVREVVLRSPSGREVRLALPPAGAYAAVAPRRDLDHALVGLAREAGAEVSDGRAVREVEVDSGGVTLRLDGDAVVTAAYVVAADGAWSPVRKALGASEEGYRGDWYAFRQYWSGTSAAARAMWVWFEPDLLPGYAWSFPLPGDRVNLGYGIARGSGHAVGDMAEQWRELLTRPHIAGVLGPGAEPEGPHRAWPIPARVWRSSLSAGGGRVLFAGDAARATDPLTGEGIAQALATGRLAAAAVLGADGADPATVAAAYRRSVARELFADHRLAKLLGRGLSHRKGARTAIRAAGLSEGTRRQFARWLFEDYPRALVLTPRRWRRGAVSTPGAYSS